MNNRHPFFKQIQKVAKYFNVKSMFADYDMINNKVIMIPYKKRVHDEPNLVFINNIPCAVAYNLYKMKAKRIEDNIFVSKSQDDGVITYGLHNTDGELVAIGTYHPKAENTTTQIVNQGTDFEALVMLSNSKEEIINKLREWKEQHKKEFIL